MTAATEQPERERCPASERPPLVEVLATWLLFAAFSLVVFITYSRSSEPLYNTSGEGIANGAGRALVYLGFPVSPGVIAMTGVAYLAGRQSSLSRPWFSAVALFAVLLCSTAILPGVIDQDDLDARLVNAPAGLGVAIALGLTAWLVFARGTWRPAPWTRLDWCRVALAAVLLVLALPWLAAEVGFASDEAPVLKEVFLEYDRRPAGTGDPDPAVHAGDHHGLDGVLLALIVLALSRTLPLLRPSNLRALLSVYLALGLIYGLLNSVQDAWNEQLVKREAVSWSFPSMLEPSLTPRWAVMMLAAVFAGGAWEWHLRKGNAKGQRA